MRGPHKDPTVVHPLLFQAWVNAGIIDDDGYYTAAFVEKWREANRAGWGDNMSTSLVEKRRQQNTNLEDST